MTPVAAQASLFIEFHCGRLHMEPVPRELGVGIATFLDARDYADQATGRLALDDLPNVSMPIYRWALARLQFTNWGSDLPPSDVYLRFDCPLFEGLA